MITNTNMNDDDDGGSDNDDDDDDNNKNNNNKIKIMKNKRFKILNQILIIIIILFRLINADNNPEIIVKNIIKQQLERRHDKNHHHHHHQHHYRRTESLNNDKDSLLNLNGLLPPFTITTSSKVKPKISSPHDITTATASIPITNKSKKHNHNYNKLLIKENATSSNTSLNNIIQTKQFNYTFDVDSFLPQGYDKLMPPKHNGQPTKVRFHVWVLGLDSIDEGSMTYVADIFMSQSWKDQRLIIPDDIVFNVNTSNDPRGSYRLLPLTFIDKIWRPDSFFKNAKEVTFQEMTIPNHYIWLYSDNTILYMVKLTLLLSCAMKFQTYPHDIQNCTMKIESLSYTTNDLVFDWEESDPLVVEEHIELPQHDLIKKDIDYCTTDYSSGTFACVQVMFTIKRRLGYYIFHTYIPTCLIVIMSWISFWIKPEAVPARVTLCVTSLLTLSTQHAQSQKSLPPVSYIKAIDIFMSSCTVFVFASLMEYALVNILMADELLNGGGFVGLNWTCEPQSLTDNAHLNTKNDGQQKQRRKIFQSLNRTKKAVTNNHLKQKRERDEIHSSEKSFSVRSFSLTKLDTFHDENYNDDRFDNISARQLSINESSLFNNDKITIKRRLPFHRKSLIGFHLENFSSDDYDYDDCINRKKFQSRQFQRRNDTQYNLDQSINQFLLQSKHRCAYTVDHISRWIFPLSFLILNIVYWAYYLNVCNECSVW